MNGKTSFKQQLAPDLKLTNEHTNVQQNTQIYRNDYKYSLNRFAISLFHFSGAAHVDSTRIVFYLFMNYECIKFWSNVIYGTETADRSNQPQKMKKEREKKRKKQIIT